jgi:hypothetical protein
VSLQQSGPSLLRCSAQHISFPPPPFPMSPKSWLQGFVSHQRWWRGVSESRLTTLFTLCRRAAPFHSLLPYHTLSLPSSIQPSIP